MQKNLPYDTSFAYAYNWNAPEQDLTMALEIMEIQIDERHECHSCPAGREDHFEVELLLASNPSTPTEVLDHIAVCGKHPKILERVAGHPNVSKETLKRLAECEHTEVRSAVAENHGADEEILRNLMRDDNMDVRFTLAENPNIPADILEELSNDENPYVAYRAQVTRVRVFGTSPADVQQLPPAQSSKATRRRAM